MGSELCQHLFGAQLGTMPWPTYDAALTVDDHVTIVIQINGKVRSNVVVARGADQQTVEAKALPLVEKWLEGGRIVKKIFIPNKLLNVVIAQN
jgi:leucyl-tRNA synthetase